MRCFFLIAGSLRAALVIHVKDKRAQHAFHHNIGNQHAFHDSASASSCLYAYSPVRILEDAVCDCDIPHAAAHFASDDYAAMTMNQIAVCNCDILAWLLFRCLFRSVFQRNAVVSYIHQAICNPDILASVRVNSICIRRVPRVSDTDSSYLQIFTVQRMHRPCRRHCKLYIQNLYMLTVFKANQIWSAVRKLAHMLPPVLSLSVDRTMSAKSYVLRVLCVNTGHVNEAVPSFKL